MKQKLYRFIEFYRFSKTDKSDNIMTYMLKRFIKKFGCDAKEFEAMEIVKNSKYPILLSAGSLENLEVVFNKIKNNNPNETDVIILPGCNHGNGMYKQTELYQNKIKEFINKYI